MTTTTIKGVIHGRIIELEAEPGLPDGQTVAVTLKALAIKDDPAVFEAFRRAAGGWANDDPEGLEQYLEQTRRQRKIPPRGLPE